MSCKCSWATWLLAWQNVAVVAGVVVVNVVVVNVVVVGGSDMVLLLFVVVFALLFVLSVQVFTGLFVDDEIAFQGPLAKFVPNAVVSLFSEIHEGNQVLIYTLIAIHIAAILFYKKFKGEDLIKPMISGDKEIDPSEEAKYLPSDLGQPSKDGGLQRALALVLLSVIAVVVGYLITK